MSLILPQVIWKINCYLLQNFSPSWIFLKLLAKRQMRRPKDTDKRMRVSMKIINHHCWLLIWFRSICLSRDLNCFSVFMADESAVSNKNFDSESKLAWMFRLNCRIVGEAIERKRGKLICHVAAVDSIKQQKLMIQKTFKWNLCFTVILSQEFIPKQFFIVSRFLLQHRLQYSNFYHEPLSAFLRLTDTLLYI